MYSWGGIFKRGVLVFGVNMTMWKISGIER